MTKSFEVGRLRWILLAAKTCAAIALLFALTMPLTTCTTGGSVQQHHVEFSRYEIGTLLCFLWPIPLLLAQFASARVRRSFAILILECLAAVISWTELTIGVVISAVMSLGGIHAADGYDLASSSILGYFVLAAVQVTLGIVGNRAAQPVNQ
ncbi:MAG TPA: hypothetical protein VGQ21_03535 [Thermoanaerobaculia bacterium]|jgi:hypothetical protein|nr:hypothetical protein [Thermoanaerobaculia bacterium]